MFLKRFLLLGFFLALAGTGWGQTYWQFGEKIRDLASWTTPPEVTNATGTTCDCCGRPTLFGQRTCFHCLQRKFPHDFTGWARDVASQSGEAIRSLRDPEMQDRLIRRVFEARDHMQQQAGKDSNAQTRMNQEWLETTMKQWQGPDGRPVQDMAREAVSRYLPALRGTDYAEDPVKALSYFLIIDGKGFIKNVKCVRGPLGQPMTLLEAYEYYSGSDPKKAEDILEIIDDVRKLSDPSYEEERVPLLLDSLGRSLRLLWK